MEVISTSEKSTLNKVTSNYDHANLDVKEFHATKAGVKGLVDSGIVKIPKLFIHPPDETRSEKTSNFDDLQVPVIDFNGFDQGNRRKEIVNEIRHAAETWGFFQMVNHCIPVSVLDEILEAIKRFHEQPTEEKMKFYSHINIATQKVRFYSNGDTPNPKPADWRDTISYSFQDHQLDFQPLPQICREAISKYVKHLIGVKEVVCELLCEALGIRSDYLASIECMKSESLQCHYYPACPQPELTLGTVRHSDVCFMTILLQDNIGSGGLQVRHQNQWVHVPYLHGALIANIGNFMQLISNDKFTSAEHRVLAQRVPRFSIACFFFPSATNQLSKPYGPVKELLSDKNPPIYKDTLYSEYVKFRLKGVNGYSALSHFKL